MNKIAVFLLLLNMLGITVRAQDTVNAVSIDYDYIEDSLVYEPEEPVGYGIDERIRLFLEPYLDSLRNRQGLNTSYPRFLFDVDFDLRDSTISCWFKDIVRDECSSFISLRVELFLTIDDISLLKEIVNDPRQRELFQNTNHRKSLPSDQYSNAKLAEMRLLDIQKKQKTLIATGLANPTRGVKWD